MLTVVKNYNMNTDWYTFYANRINSTYQDYFNQQYAPFIEVIQQVRGMKVIQELGCGIGSVSKAVGGNFKGFDIDPLMVKLANQNTNTFNFHTQSIFEAEFDPLAVKVTHGVLEHFTDHEIVSILERCENSVHYVPLDKWETPSFGDERLLPYQYWLDLTTPKMWVLFNDDKDLLFVI